MRGSRLAALVLCAAVSAGWTHGNSGLSGQLLQLPIGAGGFVSDAHFANDGTVIVNTDTASAAIRPAGATAFVPVVTAASMPAADVGPGLVLGVCATAISPTNSQHVYMYFSPATGASPQPAYIYSSTNRGGTWTKSGAGFPSSTAVCNANASPTKAFTSWMAVSPGDENTLYVGTLQDGTWYTHDAGATWTEIPTGTIPVAGSSFGSLIAFDPTDATGNAGYISSYGNGIWKCTSMHTTPVCNALNSTGMPTTFKSVYVDAAGTLWVVDNTQGSGGGSLQRYLSGAWSTAATYSGNQYTAVAVDPLATGNVYLARADGCVNYALNAQTAGTPSFVGCASPAFALSASRINWQPWAADTFISLFQIAFDPSASHILYGTNGTGFYKTTAPSSGSPVTTAWNVDTSQGIENLDLTAGQGISGGGVQWTAQDRPLFYYTSFPLSYPSRYFPDNLTEIRWGVSSCNNVSANTYAGINLTNGLTISTGGITGTYNYVAPTATGLPANFTGGKCIIIDSSHWIWMGNVSGNPEPYFTANGGTSWSACTFTGGPSASSPGWLDIAQDTTSPGTIILVGNGVLTTGFWESNSLTSCAFTQKLSSLPDGLVGHIVAVPGKACAFIASSWYTGSAPPSTGNAYLTTNCGGAFGSAISGVNSVMVAGVGLSKPGNDGYPALIYQGYNNASGPNTFSIWEIDNIDSTPIAIDLDTFDNGSANKGFPVGNYDTLEFITGDLATYGLVYGGFFGSGGFYRHP